MGEVYMGGVGMGDMFFFEFMGGFCVVDHRNFSGHLLC